MVQSTGFSYKLCIPLIIHGIKLIERKKPKVLTKVKSFSFHNNNINSGRKGRGGDSSLSGGR